MTKNVYFLTTQDGVGPIKIGCSVEPVGRLQAFMNWSPYPLKILHTFEGSFEEECRIQGHFAEYHTHSEWFSPAPEIFNFIARLKGGEKLEDLIDTTGKAKGVGGIARAKKNPSYTEYLSYRIKLSHAESKVSKWGFWGDRRLQKGCKLAESFLDAWSEDGRYCENRPTAPQLEFIEKTIEHLKHLHRQNKHAEVA